MTERAVYVRLKGGLGNQMFQYAAALSLAGQCGCPLKLDLSYFPTDPLREFGLDAFGLAGPVASKEEIDTFSANKGWRRKIGKTVGRPDLLLPDGLYVEPHFHFAEDFFNRTPPVLLDGYWQSEKYFAGRADDVRAAFSSDAPKSLLSQATHERIDAAGNSVSVHVRLGDYVTGKAASKMSGSCTPDYYRRAVDTLDRALDAPTYFIFSDEPQRASELLGFIENRIVVTGDPARPAGDLALMSACKHHIIANSSFSWWGAWLNPDAEKFVIAPRLWFSRDYLRKHDAADLYPENWLTLG